MPSACGNIVENLRVTCGKKCVQLSTICHTALQQCPPSRGELAVSHDSSTIYTRKYSTAFIRYFYLLKPHLSTVSTAPIISITN